MDFLSLNVRKLVVGEISDFIKCRGKVYTQRHVAAVAVARQLGGSLYGLDGVEFVQNTHLAAPRWRIIFIATLI